MRRRWRDSSPAGCMRSWRDPRTRAVRPAGRDLDEGVTGEFSGQVALVTGAGAGIGRACANRLATAGAHLVVLDRNGDRLSEVAAEASPAGAQVEIVVGDARSRSLTPWPAPRGAATYSTSSSPASEVSARPYRWQRSARRNGRTRWRPTSPRRSWPAGRWSRSWVVSGTADRHGGVDGGPHSAPAVGAPLRCRQGRRAGVDAATGARDGCGGRDGERGAPPGSSCPRAWPVAARRCWNGSSPGSRWAGSGVRRRWPQPSVSSPDRTPDTSAARRSMSTGAASSGAPRAMPSGSGAPGRVLPRAPGVCDQTQESGVLPGRGDTVATGDGTNRFVEVEPEERAAG